MRHHRSARRGLVVSAVVLVLGAAAAFSFSCAGPPAGEVAESASAALDPVGSFGSNPGNLDMYRYVPSGIGPNAPLVVVLHGCTQSANDMAAAGGWNAMADSRKFYVVYPQQKTANNPVSCFDWFGKYNTPSDKTNITRGKGEDESIKQMVDKAKADFSIDPSRVYVVGFSAGAAMAAVMLATYPDVFAAGAIFAGIPYNCPSTSNSDVFSCQNPGKTMSSSAWGDLVRAAAPGGGRHPRVSIWQGSSDSTVGTQNEKELVKQWTDVNGLGQTPTSSSTVAGCGSSGCPHDVYADGTGVRVESYVISGMGHDYPVDPSHGCGASGSFVTDAHVCATGAVADFFLGGGSTGDGGVGPAPDASVPDSGGGHDASTPPDAGPLGCFVDNNFNHVAQGRAHDALGHALANGSNQDMGLDNFFTTTSLQEIGPNDYVIGACH
jgi:feruloyl esterase